MMLPRTIELVEVGPRDGLQNDPAAVPTTDKVALIRKLVAAGVRRIEVASFVNPRRVPQMADAEEVCAQLDGLQAIRIGLALNRRGAERALASCVDEIGAVASASDGFAQANQGRTGAQTVDDAIEIIQLALAAGRRAQATVSVAFGCPFDGEIDPEHIAQIVRRLAAAGAHEVALGDTIGIATPSDVLAVMNAAKAAAPGVPLRMHFHDTRNMAIANAWAAISAGAVTLDASIGGLGGCPFAPRATGNVASEDILYMLRGAEIETGIDLEAMVATSHWLGERLERTLPSKVARAGF